jgi:nucleotide-binding universal stress UspA family protein
VLPGTVGDLGSVLVSLKDEQNMFRVLEVVGLLLAATDPEVTLFHSESVEQGSAISELLLRGATDWLTERGLDRDRIGWHEPTAETRTRDLIELADQHDFVIMGEDEPSLAERVLGDLPARVRDRTGRAVLVVRKER